MNFGFSYVGLIYLIMLMMLVTIYGLEVTAHILENMMVAPLVTTKQLL